MWYLKSNMDRFIVLFLTNSETIFRYLKSNMDRFIDRVNNLKNYRDNYLKSNMDRFIVVSVFNHWVILNI